MIWESGYWKADLIKDAEIIERWSKKNPTTRQYVLLERKIFITSYSIRKLIEAEIIGCDFPMWNFSLNMFEKKSSKTINHMNRLNIDELYDLDKPLINSKNISFLCNTLIHSNMFILGMNEAGEIDSFLFRSFPSDKIKEDYLYRMDLEKYVSILKWIGHSDVIEQRLVKAPEEKSGFKISRTYCFNDSIPRKGLPKNLILENKYIKTCLENQ